VPLELKGTPKGEADGGVLQQIMHDAGSGMPGDGDSRHAIRHNVAEMALNDVVHIKDLKLPAGVKALQDGELIVATVKEILEVVPEAVTEEGAAEPEVIGRKPAEGEEATAEGAAAAPAAEEKKGSTEKK
jgi:large subunit ribosomal protein L25